MQTEIWKSIKGYENYEVSNLGRIKSLNYDRTGVGKVLKPIKNGKGYLQVCLFRNGKRKWLSVHRLVAAAFIPNPEGFEQVNHKDEVKTNNFVFINEGGFVDLEKSTLEWCDCKYNINYGTRTERVSKYVEASKFPDFREIELRFVSTAEAGRNGFNQGGVAACCRGCYCREGNNKYKNLYWRYAV